MQHKANQSESPTDVDSLEDRPSMPKKLALKQYRDFLLQGSKQVIEFISYIVAGYGRVEYLNFHPVYEAWPIR